MVNVALSEAASSSLRISPDNRNILGPISISIPGDENKGSYYKTSQEIAYRLHLRELFLESPDCSDLEVIVRTMIQRIENII